MKVIKRTDKSLLMSILQFLIKPIGQKLITPKKQFPAGSPKLTPHSSARKRCTIGARQVEGVWIYDMTAKARSTPPSGLKQARRRRIYYFAGGAWQMPPSPEHWKLCAEFCHLVPNCVVTVVSYPLAPNTPAPEAFPQLIKLYQSLMAESPNDEEEIVTFAGDSAGGNIVLGLVLHVLSSRSNAGCVRAPDSLLVISPTTDCTPQDSNDPVLKEAQKHDPILSVPFTNQGAAKWAGDWDPADPRLTPLNADVSVLADRGVKLYGITGSYDVLTPPTIKFRDMCEKERIEGEWLDWDGQMHCFPLAWIYGLRESKEGKEWLVDVLSR